MYASCLGATKRLVLEPSRITQCEINADGSYSVRRLDGERKGEEEKWGANQLKPVRDY